MVTASIYRIFAFLALLTFSCGGTSGPARYAPSHAEKLIPLLVWIDADSKLSEEDTLRACKEWNSKGIECYIVENKLKSHIQVYAENEQKCTEDAEDGTTTLATAWRGGKIIFNMKCFGEIGKPNRHKFRAVMVHEIGHHLGIWTHVPEKCDSDEGKKAKKHPDGKFVCGEAVMNPYYEKATHFVTQIDSLAFDIRNRFIAVVVDLSSDKPVSDPDCTYTSH